MQVGISLGITGNRRAGGFSPNVLFAGGEAGDWFDPSDLSRMWQDTAGATPVTADGQTVARIDGQRGVVSLRQSDAAKRPAYKTSAGLHWLQFDGTNDSFSSAASVSIDNVHSIVAGVKVNSLANGFNAEFLTSAFSSGELPNYFAAAIYNNGGNYMVRSIYPSIDSFNTGISLGASISNAFVLSQLRNSGTELIQRNAGAGTSLTITTSSAAITQPGFLTTGRHLDSAQFLNGNLYFLLIRGALTAGADLTALEGFAAAKTGVTLP
jgi:hypothetical protein